MKLTLQQLRGYNGEDSSKPILLAIRGIIFDVSKGIHSDSLFPRRLSFSMNTVWAFLGSSASGRSDGDLRLADNACTGAEFYGPDGMYPFAGHECARAFALISTDVADCNDNLEVSILFMCCTRLLPV
jgi:membrane-associated progesterone receptor component